MADAKKKEEPTKPTPEEKLAAAEAEVDALVKKGLKALDEFEKLDQKQVDHIVAKASVAALNKHLVLAKMAVEETHRGLVEDKATKNIFACEHVTNYLAGQKTVGIIREDDVLGIDEIAEPVGVVAGVTPVTNPTSTAIFKSLIALKTRCPIIFGFHPGAQNCSVAAAKIVRDAAIAAGAPENCIQWIEHPSIEATGALMKHDGVATILATGGPGMVKAAYSSGKPALGVGAGNAPAYVDKNVDVVRAANDLILSKHFDYGMICATEQAIIADKDIYAPLVKELKRRKAYFVNADEKAKLEQYMFGCTAYSGQTPKLNSVVPGKSPQYIAKAAGFEIPEDATILAAECKEVGENEPLTMEKLAPVQAVLKSDNKEQAFEMCEAMLKHGAGHTAAIHTNDRDLVREYGQRMHACRIIWNSPSSLGGVGDIYNAIAPSLTLGCGSYGHNSVSDNVSAVNLLNIKKIGKRRNNMQWFKVPSKIYFERDSIEYLHSMRDVERVFIVTDRSMVDLGYVTRVTDQLEQRRNKVQVQLFCDVEPDPSIQTVKKGLSLMQAFRPDTIIAIGGGSSMDAAKGMWLFYEQPDVNFDDLKQKFMDIRKRAFRYPELGKKSKLVCIPTTSGTGSEVTPFAVITDKEENKKYPLTDYSLTPTVAIVDPALTMSLPASITADTGMDVLTHATEAYVSTLASDFTDGLALQAIKMVFEYLPRAVANGKNDPEAREKMHNAATLAGMAFANAFLGMNHSLAHKIGAEFHVPHGRTNAILLPYVIRYNGTKPEKPGVWPKYNYYKADEKYAELARLIGLKFNTVEEGVVAYAKACADLGADCGIKMSFKEQGLDAKAWDTAKEKIAYLAYEDQCSPANPRVPMVTDMIDILRASYEGDTSYYTK